MVNRPQIEFCILGIIMERNPALPQLGQKLRLVQTRNIRGPPQGNPPAHEKPYGQIELQFFPSWDMGTKHLVINF